MDKLVVLNPDIPPMNTKGMAGFTLLEMLIALAVAAILLGIAAPSIQSVIQNQRLQSTLGPVSLGVFTARSEAAKSGNTITACARASDTQCGTDWNNGLLIFRDGVVVRDEAQAVRDATDEILRIVPPHGHDIALTAVASTDRTAAGAYTPAYVRFEPDGRANWKNGTVYVCDERGNTHARAMHITISGDIRPARRNTSDTDAAVKDVFGRSLSCT